MSLIYGLNISKPEEGFPVDGLKPIKQAPKLGYSAVLGMGTVFNPLIK